MKIAHVNYSDARDGVSGAVRCLMDEQKAQGDEPVLFTPNRLTQDPESIAIVSAAGVWETAMRSFEQKEGFNNLQADALLELFRQPRFADAAVVHLHGTTPAYFSYLLLPALAARPLVWSLYEVQPYTSGCSHTVMCQGWRLRSCKDCPLFPPDKKQRSEELFQLKKALYAIAPMAVVTPNAWMTDQVRSSILSERFAAEIQPLVDPAFFRRADRQEVRQRLNIPAEAFVLACFTPGGLANPFLGGPTIRELLAQWQQDNAQVILLQIGGDPQKDQLPEPFSSRVVPHDWPPEQRSAALQAADLFLHFSAHDSVGISLLEASAAGIPALAFMQAAGSQVRHLETGYLVSDNSIEAAIRALLFLRPKPPLLRHLGQNAARQVALASRDASAAAGYRDVYTKLLQGGGRNWPTATAAQEVPLLPLEGAGLDELWRISDIPQRVKQAIGKGQEALWAELDSCCRGFSPERKRERGAFVDLFISSVLSVSRHPLSPALLFDVVDKWIQHRQIPQRCGDFSPLERIALHSSTKHLRQALTQFFLATPEEYFRHLSIVQQGRFINLWAILFFNDFTTPYLEAEEHLESYRQVEATTSSQRAYPDLLIRSMYTPYAPEAVKLDMARLLKKDMPLLIQIVLAFWMVNVPYYDGDEKRQRILRRNAKAFFTSVLKDAETLPQRVILPMSTHLVVQFWRAAYLGGNLLDTISLFGDFLHQQMRRLHPQFMEPVPLRLPATGRRLRIGYVSSNFFHQAVSYYMANRILYADKQRFEIQVFSLEKRHDTMTDHIKAFSDRFVSIPYNDMGNLAETAEMIKKSELDLLIYADIGMEVVGYQLAAMRLAPVQCVLVGHGATTGLPTIDYYLSGDFEAPDADKHYREKLIRLPNLGAAQLPPAFPPVGRLKRSDFGLPEDKVLLVSCANGIKHGPERDELLVRILQQAPQAVIVLKPFMGPDLVQPLWSKRVAEAARSGGVLDRLYIIPPLAHGRDLMDFLAMGDIQLDTYPYGGWTTNMEAVYAGLAIVTQEGDQARTRWGAHILRAMGVTAGIAGNEEQYVQQAVELVNNTELRRQVRAQIQANAKNILFNGSAAQPAYEETLLRIFREAAEQKGKVVNP